jgi:GntR family transcriptional regulator, transcriptional repressor for pyruvate dehydrogenase complex
MPIQAVESLRLYRQIADQLSGLIEAGEYKVGDRLPPERTLAEQLKVSRSSVREALIALEVEGCVEIRGGTGVFVIERKATHRPDATMVPGPFDLLEVRRVLEPEAAALAARNAGGAHIRRMEQAIKGMAERGYNDSGLDADRAFHFAIAEAGGNAAMPLMLQTLWDIRQGPLYVQLEQHFRNAEVWELAIAEHRAVLDAIRARDVREAKAAMLRHVKNAETRFASGWAERSESPRKADGR